jgi:hypothetical protein
LADGQSPPGEIGPLCSVAEARICVLVLGMHRSGTSALTRVLSLLGANLPKILIGSGPGNESGHWEPQRIVRLNDRLLSELGSCWDDWSRIDVSQLAPDRIAEYKSELGRLLREDCGDSSLFVLKDPRISRLLPLVCEVARAENIDLRVALVLRNPIEVVDSLEKRKETWTAGYTRVDAALLWLRHMLDAEAASRDMTRVTVSYDALLRDWRSCVDKLLNGLRIPLLPPSPEAAANIEAFLSPSQRHHQRTANDVRLDPSMKTWVADAFEAMRTLEVEPQAHAAFLALDRVSDELDTGAPAIRPLLTEARACHKREAGALMAILASREAEACALRERVLALEAELVRAKSFDQLMRDLLAKFTWRKVARRLESHNGLRR